MKKFILLFVLLNSYLSFSQLSELSEAFKNDDGFLGDIYENVRSSAIKSWDDNHVMIVAQINQNIEACFELMTLLPEMDETEKKIFRNGLDMWVDDADKLTYERNLDSSDGELIFKTCRFNWVMVKAHFEQQSKASKSY